MTAGKLGLIPLLLLALMIGLLTLLANASTPAALSQGDGAEARARQHLREKAPELGLRPDLSDLQPVSVRKGLSAEHVRFQQTLGGAPVFGAYVSVSLPEDVKQPPIVRNRYVPKLRPRVTRAALDPGEARIVVGREISLAEANLRGEVTAN